ncbi:hypothetical protein V2J09_000306 [Rumex salicifolius]
MRCLHLRLFFFLLLAVNCRSQFFGFPGGIGGFFGGSGGDGGYRGQGRTPMQNDGVGNWMLFSKDSGVSAMHIQLMPNNKAIIFDATSLGKSNIQLPPNNCRFIPPNVTDCSSHSVEFDTVTAKIRVLKVMSDPWCSSGGLSVDGTLISTGGWADGERSIRYFDGCNTCDWRESNQKLSDIRWYATQVQLGDGRYLLVGGRRAFNYEFLAPEGSPSQGKINFPFLQQTTDIYENNLYPFVHLAPNGNLFILANNKSILLDVSTNSIVRTFPDIPGGARNYPGSASSTLLPIRLRPGQARADDIEVLVCGGSQTLAFGRAENEGVYLPALDTCGRMKFMSPNNNNNPQWEMEKMPSPRVMGDMINLPNGQILLLNGAQKGSSGWQYADEPNLTPVIYSPNEPKGMRFRVLIATDIARMYHSTSALLPTGAVLVAGSNTNPNYRYDAKFPTELRVEKFFPPYLAGELDQCRPTVNGMLVRKTASYGEPLAVPFELGGQGFVRAEDVAVTLYKVPFTTHGYSMNQRLLDLGVVSVGPAGFPGQWSVVAEAPVNGQLAPPGYYLLFVSFRGVPGSGSWIKLS